MWAAGIPFLLPFPAWQLMVGYISSMTVLTYGLGPIVLLVLRRNQPKIKRPFRLWGAEILAPLAFICSNWIIYWTGFNTNSFLFGLVAAGFALYALFYYYVAKKPHKDFGWRYIAWLLPWFGGMWALSALSDIGGGFGVLGFWPGVALVAVWSLIVIALALRSALPAVETAKVMVRMDTMCRKARHVTDGGDNRSARYCTVIRPTPTTANAVPTTTHFVIFSFRTNAAIGRTNNGSVELSVLAMLTCIFSMAKSDSQNPPNVTTKTDTKNSAANRGIEQKP